MRTAPASVKSGASCVIGSRKSSKRSLLDYMLRQGPAESKIFGLVEHFQFSGSWGRLDEGRPAVDPSVMRSVQHRHLTLT